MQKTTITIIGVIVLILIAAALYASFTTKTTVPTDREQAIKNDENEPDTTINVKHQYKDSEHAFVGLLDLPTPCHSFNAEVQSSENNHRANIALTITPPAEGVMCAQVIAPKTFKVTHKGAEDMPFTATLNGEIVKLNVFEVGEDEDIDTVELFIKG